MNEKKCLECSSKGDKRFSAMYAKVMIFGATDTIENHYQRCKRDVVGGPVKKGQPVDHMVVCGRKFPAAMLTDLYRLLWVKYLDTNPALVDYARQFDEFTDMFRGKNTINCQADVIRDYVADRDKLIRSASGLANELKKIKGSIRKNRQMVDDLCNALTDGSLLLEHLDEEKVLRLRALLERGGFDG